MLFARGPAPAYTQSGAPVVREASSVPARAEILFGGDMMFDRSIRATVEANGDDFIFSCLDPMLRSADIVVANLEGPITQSASVSIGTDVGDEGNFTFTFPTSTARLLARHNMRMVNIGNNHVMNFGREGLAETRGWLDAGGVLYFGEPDLGEAERVERVSVRGIPFSFVNWSDWTSDKTDHTVAQVRKEADMGRVVVLYAHWGEEYVAQPLPRVKQLARSFIDAGASIVIGSHPHVVQEREFYRGAYIYYSLGNLIFDQYWNEDVRTGLLVRAVFGPRGVVSVEEIPVHLERDRRTCPATPDRARNGSSRRTSPRIL